jgi:3-(3-hydroxy-phenyl)propionate hydroxylase
LAPTFLLASATADAQDWLSRQSLDMWRRIGGARVVIGQIGEEQAARHDGLRHLAERGRLFVDWLARHGATAAIVRPDRYLYGIARDRDGLNRLVETLGEQIFGR